MANRRGEKTRKSKPRTDGGDFQEMLREIQGKARRPAQAAALYYHGAHRFDLVGQIGRACVGKSVLRRRAQHAAIPKLPRPGSRGCE